MKTERTQPMRVPAPVTPRAPVEQAPAPSSSAVDGFSTQRAMAPPPEASPESWTQLGALQKARPVVPILSGDPASRGKKLTLPPVPPTEKGFRFTFAPHVDVGLFDPDMHAPLLAAALESQAALGDTKLSFYPFSNVSAKSLEELAGQLQLKMMLEGEEHAGKLLFRKVDITEGGTDRKAEFDSWFRGDAAVPVRFQRALETALQAPLAELEVGRLNVRSTDVYGVLPTWSRQHLIVSNPRLQRAVVLELKWDSKTE